MTTNITINDKEYVLEQLSPDIRNLLELHQLWNNEIINLKNDIIRNEIAIKQIDKVLTDELASLDGNKE